MTGVETRTHPLAPFGVPLPAGVATAPVEPAVGSGAEGGPAPAGVATAAAVAVAGSVGPPASAPRAADELAAARAALAAGDRADAAVRLAVVLRVSPSLAPAVLDVAAAEPGPEFDLVRGDALRLVGHESQARRSYAAAVSRLGTDASRTGDRSSPDVAPTDPEVAEAEARAEAEAQVEAEAEIAATAEPVEPGDEPSDQG